MRPDSDESSIFDDPLTREEVEQYRKERAKIGRILDSIDAMKGGRLGRIMDAVLVSATVLLILARFAFGWVDNILSLELGLILLSLKIVLLIKMQNNYNHFIFMIMHTIDHNQTMLGEKLDRIAEAVERG